DLVPILERLEFQGEEIKALREAMEQGFSKVWDELKAQRESTERGFSKVWDDLKAQRESTERGFSKVWDELKAQREELKAQREAMEQGFSKVWDELKTQRDELKAQREAMEQGFQNMWDEMKELRKSQNRLHRRMDKHEAFWRKIGGEELELHSLMWFQGVLNAKGFPSDNLKWGVKFEDPQRRLGTSEIEIDLFQENPLLVVEVTSFVDSLDKLLRFVKKIKFIREKYGKTPKAVFITYRIAKEIEEAFMEIQKANEIELITIGRKLDFSFLDEDEED
ncbi:MAG: DUF632 domain-containing protein, partial [Methanobacteriota archaeon]